MSLPLPYVTHFLGPLADRTITRISGELEDSLLTHAKYVNLKESLPGQVTEFLRKTKSDRIRFPDEKKRLSDTVANSTTQGTGKWFEARKKCHVTATKLRELLGIGFNTVAEGLYYDVEQKKRYISPFLQTLFDRGKNMEPVIIDHLRSQGCQAIYECGLVDAKCGDLRVGASPDGLINWNIPQTPQEPLTCSTCHQKLPKKEEEEMRCVEEEIYIMGVELKAPKPDGKWGGVLPIKYYTQLLLTMGVFDTLGIPVYNFLYCEYRPSETHIYLVKFDRSLWLHMLVYIHEFVNCKRELMNMKACYIGSQWEEFKKKYKIRAQEEWQPKRKRSVSKEDPIEDDEKEEETCMFDESAQHPLQFPPLIMSSAAAPLHLEGK